MPSEKLDEPRIGIERSRTSISATVTKLPAESVLRFHLLRESRVIESTSPTTVPNWRPKFNPSEGTFTVRCDVNLATGARLTVDSPKIHFGQNFQHVQPRKVRQAPANNPAPSFKHQIHFESRKAYRSPEYTAWLLDVKTNTYRFADLLGIATPALELDPKPLSELPLEPGTVVKPLTGVMSQGVYIIDDSHIIDLPNNKSIDSLDELRLSMQKNIDNGEVKDDLWIRERLIRSDHSPNEPARDLKFYSFYGRIYLALETIRSPEVRRCWYDIGSNRIDTGKYTKVLFEGNGIPSQYYDAAELISLNIPSPFARIDLLASPDGPVINEVTPKPGGSNQFADSVDRQLGNYLNAAETRLRIDLLDGKPFSAFNAIRGLHTRSSY